MRHSIRSICLVVASEMTVTAFLRRHIIALSDSYDVTLVVNTQSHDFAAKLGLPVKVVPLAIERRIAPIADFKALHRLIRLFRRQQFDLVHSVTPKAGLLAMLAGKISGVRFRIHTFTGQVWATRQGFSRIFLKGMDRMLASSATHLLADSFSQRQFLVEQGVAQEGKINVLADGSISGVDAERFRPNNVVRREIRDQFAVSDDAVLLLFLGRLNRDKGVLDLSKAFMDVSETCPQLHLLFVGPDEGKLKDEIKRMTEKQTLQVHFVDHTDKPEAYFASADIFCLPSYREGFGSVIIEAAACGVPAIGSRIYGISDAIVEGQTGMLFETGDISALSNAIERMTCDSDFRHLLGKGALRRARDDFPTKRLVQAWIDYYDGLQ